MAIYTKVRFTLKMYIFLGDIRYKNRLSVNSAEIGVKMRAHELILN